MVREDTDGARVSIHRLSRRRPRRLLALGAILALLAAGCGGDDDRAAPVEQETTTTTAAGTDTSTTAVTEAPTATTTTPASRTAGTTARSTGTTARAATKTAVGAVASQVKGGITNVTAASTTAPSKEIQPGGTITYLKSSDIGSLDPITFQNTGSTDGPAASMIYDMLAFSDPGTGSVVAQTMESLTSTDALVWTLKVRPNISFSDGTPYDAAAVRFSWQRLQDPKNGAARASQANTMASMDVVDPLTLRITLKSKNAVFPQIVALIAYIGSPAAIQAKGSGFASDPVGAGPFTFKSWTRDSQMVLVRNPRYWNAPRPFVDQVVVRVISDTSQRINTFNTTGGATVMHINTAPDAEQAAKQGGIPNRTTLNGGTVLYFNVRKAPFNDLRARQAVSMAIDRVEMIKTLDNGLIPPMDSVFRHESPFYDPAIVQIGHDPAKAQQLFDQLAADRGSPLEFTLSTFNVNVYPIAAQYIQGVLNKFRNVKVTIDAASTPAQVTRVTNGDFVAALYGNPFDDPDPVWTTTFSCAAAAQFTGFCSTAFDNAINHQRVTLDPKERIADIKDAQREFYAQIPAMYFELRTQWYFTNPPVQDFQLANDGLVLYDRIWIKSR